MDLAKVHRAGEMTPRIMKLTLATYNIHAGIGMDGHFNPQRITKVLAELNADIVTLQEVEHHQVGGQDMLDYLATETGYKSIAGPTLQRNRRHYGNALLTRLPVLSVRLIDLSIPNREPRGAIDIVLEGKADPLHVVATHLGLRPSERRHQVRHLLTLFDPDSDDIAILMGDLNEWFLWGRILRWLHAYFQPVPAKATYPARCPLFALDRIWVRPHNKLISLQVHNSKMARSASDHLPLKAVIRL